MPAVAGNEGSLIKLNYNSRARDRIPANANDQHVAPGRTIELPLPQPARRTVNATKPEPARKHIDNAASAAASPPDQSFVSQVRAALTNVDAKIGEERFRFKKMKNNPMQSSEIITTMPTAD